MVAEGIELSDQTDLLRQAHTAHADHRFAASFDAFERADRLGELAPDDMVTWSDAAWWLGRADRSLQLAEQAHLRLVEQGDSTRAAREAIGLGFLLMLRGDLAAGSGWMQRGRSLLERGDDPGARGYLAHLDAETALSDGDYERAIDLAQQARDAGRGMADTALLSLALMTEATARLRGGSFAEALALLDEAMLPVQAGQVPPDFAGNLYCQTIAICWEVGDLRRAREWTAATERWCSTFDSALMFSGICRMHRVQLRQVAGEWDLAAEEARVVCAELIDMNVSVVAEGHYLLGDLLRLRDEAAEAEAAYLRAHELGRDPQPGLALLAARSGQPATALASLLTSLAGYRGGAYGRAPLLRALVEVAIEAGDVRAASDGAEELSGLAERWKSDGLAAVAVHARGAVQLASLDPESAVGSLREAVARWRELDAPYDCARARITLAGALTALGDHTAARLELDTAGVALTSLGAMADLEGLARAGGKASLPAGLTPREAEIIALVADGSTNRQVATTLVISEKTVARHLANVYLKLGVPNRTAAVAWARRQGLHPSA